MFEPDFMAKEKGLEEECRTWVVSDELHWRDRDIYSVGG